MAVGAFLPLALYVAISASVGIRLVTLWRRTGGLPERSLGLGLLLVSLSTLFTVTGRVPALAMEPVGRIGFASGLTLAAVGLSLLISFNLHVFRPRVPWARSLCFALAAVMFSGVAYMSLVNFAGESVDAIKREMRPGTLAMMIAVLCAFVWGAIESFSCHAAARRRLALGLGDAVIVNRFLLWALASVASSVLLLAVIGCVLADMVIMREPIPLASIAASGSVMSACWYLTFFAPGWYRRYITARNPR